MSILEEYRRSLKSTEAEEFIDLVFFRPVAYFFVRAIYRLPITPNLISIFSLFAGLTAAYFFAFGEPTAWIWAAEWYALANLLDCADGQLARLQKSGTPLGRLIDGVVDYVSSIAIFLAIGIGLSTSDLGAWFLVILVGASSALHAVFFDRYQNAFIAAMRGSFEPVRDEFIAFTNEVNTLRRNRRDGLKVLLLTFYLKYLQIQQRFGDVPFSNPSLYCSSNRWMIRLWSYLGPSTNRTLLILCALFNRLDFYLWLVVALGNAWLLICFLSQRRIDRRLSDQSVPSVQSS